MINWIVNNLVGIVGIFIGGFIAVILFLLSEKLNFKDKLSHRDEIRKNVENILQKIRTGIRRKVELINVKKYTTHYPHTNNKDFKGYTYFAAELKALRFDGVEFFCGVKEVYKKPNGKLSLSEKEGSIIEKYNIFEVGIIPYEWIEYVDLTGDEFSYRPQFFAKFKGIDKTPYKRIVYYKESNNYDKQNDPLDMKWTQAEVEK